MGNGCSRGWTMEAHRGTERVRNYHVAATTPGGRRRSCTYEQPVGEDGDDGLGRVDQPLTSASAWRAV